MILISPGLVIGKRKIFCEDFLRKIFRFHNEDSMFWKDGFQLVWRNGDMDDQVGMKCHVISGGNIHGDPTETQVYAYSWYYTWPTTGESKSANLMSSFVAKIAVLISICLYLL